MTTAPQRVRVTDVSPRDGLQNETAVIPTLQKIRLVQLLCDARPDEIEVSSFVSPRWIPQLGDAADVFAGAAPFKRPGQLFSALVPNEKGLDAALAVNDSAASRLIDKVSVFTAASETFSKRNTNATIAETLARFAPVIRRAHDARLLVRGYVSCIIACPFEGPIAPARVADVCRRLADLGVDELDLGDTIGAATPTSIAAVLDACSPFAPPASTHADPTLTLHLHDTLGNAAECARAALALGVRSFDASVAGLGGCPYASTPQRRAPGNIATETLIRTLHAAGFTTAVDPAALDAAARFAACMLADARASSTSP